MAQVCARREEFEQADVRIFVVSFTDNLEWAEQWIEETCQAFPLLLDPERQLYQAFGLERSLLRSWNLRTLWRYARYVLSGRKLKGIKGDSAQLGGDFLLDGSGSLIFAYRSHDPTDRPSVDRLMQAVNTLPSANEGS